MLERACTSSSGFVVVVTLVSWIAFFSLFGISCVQGYVYYANYPRDWMFQKISVRILFCVVLYDSSFTDETLGRCSSVSQSVCSIRLRLPNPKHQSHGCDPSGGDNSCNVQLLDWAVWETDGAASRRLVRQFEYLSQTIPWHFHLKEYQGADPHERPCLIPWMIIPGTLSHYP